MAERWVLLKELAAETGLAARTIQYIRAREPGVLVTREGTNGVEYKQPDCAVALRNREVEKSSTDKRNRSGAIREKDERARKLRADADRSEMLAAKLRGELAPVAEMNAAVERLATAVRNEVEGLRSRFTLAIVGLQSPQDAAKVLDEMARQILAALVESALDGVDDTEPDSLEDAA